MARSIHSTKKDRLRELKFAANDDVPPSKGMTPLERGGLQKDLAKLNTVWKRKAAKHDVPAYKQLELKEKISSKIKRRRQIVQP